MDHIDEEDHTSGNTTRKDSLRLAPHLTLLQGDREHPSKEEDQDGEHDVLEFTDAVKNAVVETDDIIPAPCIDIGAQEYPQSTAEKSGKERGREETCESLDCHVIRGCHNGSG